MENNAKNCKLTTCPITDGTEQVEKKRRRSSILKSKKLRNPFGDLDLGVEDDQDSDTAILSRTSLRRVSFARSNTVKPFAQDPEKNTIWDSTYEESIERSDHEDKNLLGFTKAPGNGEDREIWIAHTTEEVGGDAVVDDVEDMELTLAKENVLIEDNVIYLKRTNRNSTHMASEDKENLFYTSEICSEMELTLPVVTNNCEISRNQFCSKNIPSGTNAINCEMEFTGIIPGIQMCSSNADTVVKVSNDMELTLGVSNLNKLPVTNSCEISRNQSDSKNIPGGAQAMNSEMEFTGIIPGIQMCSSNADSVVKVSNDMELTNLNKEILIVSSKINLSISQSISKSCHKPQNALVDTLTPKQCIEKKDEIEAISSPKDLCNGNASTSNPIECADISAQLFHKSKEVEKSIKEINSMSLQTPHSSFHGSSMGLQSCDDTQHLLNINLSSKKPPKSDFSKVIANEYDLTLLSSKFLPLDINGDSFRVSMSNTDSNSRQDVNRPKDEGDCAGLNRTGERCEGALSESGGGALKIDESNTSWISAIIQADQHTLNISQTDISFSDTIEESASLNSEAELESDVKMVLKAKLGFDKSVSTKTPRNICEEVQKNYADQKHLWFDVIVPELVWMKTSITNMYKDNEVSEDSDSDTTSELSIAVDPCTKRLSFFNFSDEKVSDIVLPSLKEKIQELHSRSDGYWNIVLFENGTCKFDALSKTVIFIVELKEYDGEVLSIEIEDLKNEYTPINAYLRKIFLERLLPKSIQSALGEKFDVLSLLDYVQITNQKVADMRKTFINLVETYDFTIDDDFIIQFTVASMKLELIWEFTFNLLELDTVSDNTIKANATLGQLRKKDIKSCFVGCPKGFNFMATFFGSVSELVHNLEQKRKLGEEAFPESLLKMVLDKKKSPSEVLVTKFNMNVTREDILTLTDSNWLNDVIINFYMNLITERGKLNKWPKAFAFNSFFYQKIAVEGQSSVKRWTKSVDIFTYDIIIVPVFGETHWSVVMIDFRKKEMNHFDSLQTDVSDDCLNNLLKYIQDEHEEKKNKNLNVSSWKLRNVKDLSPQLNSDDCGVFACAYAESVTRCEKIKLSQSDIPNIRKRMINEILKSKLFIT